MADNKSEINVINKLIAKMKEKRAQQRPNNKEKSTGWARFWDFCAGLFMMLIIAGCVFGAVMTVYVIKYVDPTATIDIAGLKYTTLMLAQDSITGEYIETAKVYSDENRIWVEIGDVPIHVQKAVVASEDKRFYDHHGIDWIRTFGATANLVLNFWGNKAGGSTLTQQLIKNVTGDKEVTIERKVQEIMRALNLEKTVSKDIILEAYMNTMYLGYSCNGIQSAAKFYFGKDVSELTVTEAACIVVITRYPTANNPILHPDKNKTAYLYVLKTMYQQGWLTKAEYEAAINQELVFVGQSETVTTTDVYSWYEDQVYNDVLSDLQTELGYTASTAKYVLQNGGLRIYMAVDLNVQKAMEDQYYNEANFIKENRDDQPQSAMAIMDYNGRVLGIVGGKGEKTANLLWSRATDSSRSSGSAIKPLSVYGLAIEYDIIYWSSKLLDGPIQLYDDYGEPYNWPNNYYSGYKGLVTLDYAIQRSTNTVAARVLQMVTPEVSFNFLYNKLHMTTLVKSERINGKTFSDIGLAPLSMGSLTNGVTVLDMCAAYQIYGGEGGLYTQPYTYTRVEDANGNVILSKNPTATRVMTEESAFIMNRLMQRVVEGDNGTGRKASQLGYQVAAKTGTTTDYNDRWFVGLTPYYVGVVWTGYDTKTEMDESLSNPSLDAWLKIMKVVHEGKEQAEFFDSDLVERRLYCTVSGLMAGPGCQNTAYGWYKKAQFIETCDVCGNQ